MKFPVLITDETQKVETEFPTLYGLDEIVPAETNQEDEEHDVLDSHFFKDALHLPVNEAETIKTVYPRIMQTIEALWGTQELQNKFARWLLTDQEGRKGWPNEVYKALFVIADFHSIAFGLESQPVWDDTRDKW